MRLEARRKNSWRANVVLARELEGMLDGHCGRGKHSSLASSWRQKAGQYCRLFIKERLPGSDLVEPAGSVEAWRDPMVGWGGRVGRGRDGPVGEAGEGSATVLTANFVLGTLDDGIFGKLLERKPATMLLNTKCFNCLCKSL